MGALGVEGISLAGGVSFIYDFEPIFANQTLSGIDKSGL
jgi:hypothetical protein